jgi:hypothetical protein
MQGPDFNLGSAGDGLQAAHHLLLPWMLATTSQGRLEYADVPTLALTNDQGGVAGH